METTSDRNARRIAEYVIEKALAGHFGFFRLVLDMVDGKLRQTAEDEMTFEADCARRGRRRGGRLRTVSGQA